MWETHAPQYIYGAFCFDDAFNAPVGASPLQIGVGVSIEVSFTFSQSFYNSCNFAFYLLLRTFLSKEPSKTLDYSTTFGFPVSVRVSNLFFIIGWFGCFWGVLFGSAKVFGSRFLVFVTGGM